MKVSSALLAFAAMGLAQRQVAVGLELPDPRGFRFGEVVERIRAGVELDPPRNPTNAIVIIHWNPAPDLVFDTYQISGIPGYHSKGRVESFLKEFYSKAAFPKSGPEVPNVVICGNNWGAGLELTGMLVDHSKEFDFSVFRVGGYSFQSVKLLEEPEPRKTAIKRAFDASAPVTAPDKR